MKRTIEQRLVEDLGAEFVGSLEKLGEFPVMDGEDSGDDLLEAAVSWLNEKQLLSSTQNVAHALTTAIPSGKDLLTVYVYHDESCTEYQFRQEAEPHKKRFHLIGAYVLIPKVDEVA